MFRNAGPSAGLEKEAKDRSIGSWKKWQFFRRKRRKLVEEVPKDDLVFESPKIKKNLQNQLTKRSSVESGPVTKAAKELDNAQVMARPRPISQVIVIPHQTGPQASPMCRSKSDYTAAAPSGRSPASILDELLAKQKSRDNPRVVCAGLVKSRAKEYEAKIAESEKLRDNMKLQVKRSEHPQTIPPTQPSVMNVSNISSISTSSGLFGSYSRGSIPAILSSSTNSKEASPSDESKDSGSKVESRGAPSSMSACPSESEHNFLIDDEYRDQPDLTLQEELESELSEMSIDFDDLNYAQRGPLDTAKDLSRAVFFESMAMQSSFQQHSRSDFLSRFRKAKSNGDPSGIPVPNQPNQSGASTGRGFHIWKRSNKERSNSLSSEDSNSSSHVCRCREVMNLSQDIVSIKTYLHKLRRILQEADTSTPGLKSELLNGHGFFEENGFNASLSSQMSSLSGVQSHADEINDLRRQLVYLQQQNVEKDRTIKQLQRQLDFHPSPMRTPSPLVTNNAATQTERPTRAISCGVSLTSDGSSYPSSGSEKSSSSHRIDGLKSARLRRSRTPLPRRVIMCSDDGTLRIPIRNPKDPPQPWK